MASSRAAAQVRAQSLQHGDEQQADHTRGYAAQREPMPRCLCPISPEWRAKTAGGMTLADSARPRRRRSAAWLKASRCPILPPNSRLARWSTIH